MKYPHGNRIHIKVFLFVLVIFFSSLNGFAEEKQGPEDTAVKIEVGEEVLVARDVINDRPIWCGRTNALIYVVDGVGVFWHDIETGKKVRFAGWGSFPLVCTTDGKWVIYRDYLPFEDLADRADDGAREPDPLADFLGVIFTDKRPMAELWRYEFETGRRQKIAYIFEDEARGVAIDDSSPEGMKIYLGQQPDKRTEMPEPKWAVVWSLQEKRASIHLWLNDFSAVIGILYNQDRDRPGIEVEVFSPRRKFFVVYPELDSFYPLLVDGRGRVFIREQGVKVIERCDIDTDKETLSCVRVLEIEGGEERPDSCPQCPLSPVSTDSYVNSIDVFSDDETMLFVADGDECVRIMRIGEKEAGCFTSSRYEIGGEVTISPDERWVAFLVDRRIGPGPYKLLQNYDIDLYMLKVKKD